MTYYLDLTDNAKADIAAHKKVGNKAVIHKLLALLEELAKHPFTGTGKPEPLKHSLTGLWSRRINREHRVVYEVKGNVVFVLSAKGHY
jgi:toxin YoeB